MSGYEIGEEVFAVVMMPVEAELFKADPTSKLEANTVIKGKIINRTEVEEDPSKFLYELQGFKGALPSKKVYKDPKKAKEAALASIKHEEVREAIEKQLNKWIK